MFRLVLLVIATVMLLLLAYGLAKGKKFAYLLNALDDEKYPLKELYVVGSVLNEIPLFRLRGELERKLKQQMLLLHDETYYQYFTYVAWSQFLSLSVLALGFGCALASLTPAPATYLFCGVAAVFEMLAYYLAIGRDREALQARTDACMLEFSNMASKLSLMLDANLIVTDAWRKVAYGKDGPLYEMMRRSCEVLDQGQPIAVALDKFSLLVGNQEIKKFTSAMIQCLEKGGTRELILYLNGHIQELWAHKRQLALQRGEKAAGKLIVPITISFGGILLIILSSTIQNMQF